MAEGSHEAQSTTGTGKDNQPHKFSSTQFDINGPVADEIRAKGAAIPDADLAPDGREESPHLTVKYGLHTGDVEEVRKALAGQGPIRAVLGKTSIFQKEGEHDVVKVDVKGPALHALNKTVADALPHTDTYPVYKPHVTLAYVKPGLGKKYAGDASLVGKEIRIDRVTFSDQQGNKTEIPLGQPRGVKSAPEQVVPAASQGLEGGAGQTPAAAVPVKSPRTMKLKDLVAELESGGVEVPKGLDTPRGELVSGVEALRAMGAKNEAISGGGADVGRSRAPADKGPVEDAGLAPAASGDAGSGGESGRGPASSRPAHGEQSLGTPEPRGAEPVAETGAAARGNGAGPEGPHGGGAAEAVEDPRLTTARKEQEAQPETIGISTPERAAMRKRIENEYYEKQSKDTDANRIAYIVIGPPASGKSSTAVKPLAKAGRAMVVDSDDIKESLPEFEGGKFAGAVHKESSVIAEEVQKRAMDSGKNIVLPIVGKNADKVVELSAAMRGRGYTPHLILVDLPPDKGSDRAVERFYQTRRWVDPAYVRIVGTSPVAAYDAARKVGGYESYTRISNDVPRGEPPVFIEQSGSPDHAVTQAIGRPGDVHRGRRAERGQAVASTAARSGPSESGGAPRGGQSPRSLAATDIPAYQWETKPLLVKDGVDVLSLEAAKTGPALRIIHAAESSDIKHRFDDATAAHVEAAYRTVLKPVELPPGFQEDMPRTRGTDTSPEKPTTITRLFAMPGKGAEVAAIAKQMAKVGAEKPDKYAAGTYKAREIDKYKVRQPPKEFKDNGERMAGMMEGAAKQESRYALSAVSVEKGGESMVVTDGRALWLVEQRGDPIAKEGMYEYGPTKGKLVPVTDKERLDKGFPPYRDILKGAMEAEELAPGSMKQHGPQRDIAATIRAVKRAALMSSDEGWEGGTRGLVMGVNGDGSLGFVARADGRGMAQIGVRDDWKPLAGVNPKLLIPALEFLGRNGNASFKLRYKAPNKPMVFEAGSNHKSPRTGWTGRKTTCLIMPVNADLSAAEQIVRPAPTPKTEPEVQAVARNPVALYVRPMSERAGDFLAAWERSDVESRRQMVTPIEPELRQAIQDRLDAAPGDNPAVRTALGLEPKPSTEAADQPPEESGPQSDEMNGPLSGLDIPHVPEQGGTEAAAAWDEAWRAALEYIPQAQFDAATEPLDRVKADIESGDIVGARQRLRDLTYKGPHLWTPPTVESLIGGLDEKELRALAQQLHLRDRGPIDTVRALIAKRPVDEVQAAVAHQNGEPDPAIKRVEAAGVPTDDQMAAVMQHGTEAGPGLGFASGSPSAVAATTGRFQLPDLLEFIGAGRALFRAAMGKVAPNHYRLSEKLASAYSRAGASMVYAENRAAEAHDLLVRAAQESLKKSGMKDPSRFAALQVANKARAILTEDNLRGLEDQRRQEAADALVEAGKAIAKGDTAEADRLKDQAKGLEADAAAVGTMIGQDVPGLRDAADFQFGLVDPHVKVVLEVYDKEINPELDAMFKAGKGIAQSEILPSRGRHTGIRINLMAEKDAAGNVLNRPAIMGESRGNMFAKLLPKSRVDRWASGTAAAYNTNSLEGIKNSYAALTKPARMREYVEQGVADGLMIKRPGLGGGSPVVDGRTYQAMPGQYAGEGKIVYVDPRISLEARKLLGSDVRFTIPVLTKLWGLETGLGLAGLAERLYHVGTLLGRVQEALPVSHASPSATKGVVMSALDSGFIGLGHAMYKIGANAVGSLRETPAALAKASARSSIGAQRPAGATDAILSRFRHAPDLQLIDRAARAAMQDFYALGLKSGQIKDTESNEREFINQLGQYIPQLQGYVTDIAKSTAFSSFLVQKKARLAQTVRGVTGSPGVEASSWGSWWRLRSNILARLVGTAAQIAVLSYFFSGKMMGRPGTKFGNIDTGLDDKDGKPIQIPTRWLFGLQFLVTSGIGGGVEASRMGREGSRLSASQITSEAAQQGPLAYIMGLAGPGPQVTAVGLTGHRLDARLTDATPLKPPGKSPIVHNLETAAAQINPPLTHAVASGARLVGLPTVADSMNKYTGQPSESFIKSSVRSLGVTSGMAQAKAENMPEMIAGSEQKGAAEKIAALAKTVPLANDERHKFVESELSKLGSDDEFQVRKKLKMMGLWRMVPGLDPDAAPAPAAR